MDYRAKNWRLVYNLLTLVGVAYVRIGSCMETFECVCVFVIVCK